MESLSEFISRVKKSRESKIFKINNSYGVYDYFKYYRKNKPKDKLYIITEKQYYSIIRRFNQILADILVLESEVKLPLRMGSIEIRKHTLSGPSFKDGVLLYNAPIDWNATLKLWYEDKESYEKKVVIKQENRELIKILYNKFSANYNNKIFYHFSINKYLRERIKALNKQGKIEAFRLWK